MAESSRLRLLFLRHLSKPAHNRPIYQAIAKRQVRSILEMGVGTGERALRMIEAATAHSPAEQVRYTGVDLFEACRPQAEAISLISAHRMLHATGARVQLVPGDPLAALARVANGLGATDLVIVSRDVDAEAMDRAWFYVPRILHGESLVLVEASTPEGEIDLRAMPQAEIDRRSAARFVRKAA